MKTKVKIIEAIKVKATSVWSCGTEITTDAEYYPDTGELIVETSDSLPDDDSTLEREYITLPDGEEIEVCTDCHEYTMGTEVGDNADLSYGETSVCRNPDCESHQ